MFYTSRQSLLAYEDPACSKSKEAARIHYKTHWRIDPLLETEYD